MATPSDDDAWFDSVVKENSDWLKTAAAQKLDGDVHAAEDVSQIVFRKLWKQGRASVAGHVRSRLHNLLTNEVRSWRRQSHAASPVQPPGWANDDYETVLARTDVQRAMKKLPFDTQTLLHMYMTYMTDAEVAEELDITPDAARQRIHRAKADLVALLGPDYCRLQLPRTTDELTCRSDHDQP